MIRKNGDLLTIALISLFVLGGCNNPSGVGLDVSPDEEIDVLMTDTVTVGAYTVLDDSAYSASSGFTVFGLFQDPEIGETRADLAVEIAPAESFKQIRPDANMDSAILVLPYVSEFFGDTVNSDFMIEVRHLDERFTSVAASNKVWSVKGEIIGSKRIGRFGYKPTDSLSIVKHVDGKDSVIKVVPQLRIALSSDFFKELFSTSVDSATLYNATNFAEHVKGLYVSVNKAASQGIGGIGALGAVTGVSGIELTYRQLSDTAGTTGKIDTIRNFFPVYPNSSGTGSRAGLVSAVTHQYSDAVQEQLSQPGVGFDRIYLRAPAGLRAKLVFPYIDALKGRNILINKAELVLPIATEGQGTYHTVSPRLTLYREDIAGRRQNVPDGSALSQYGVPMDPRSLNYINFGGWLRSSQDRYTFHLTSYIQDVINGKINGRELYVAPVSPYEQTVPLNPAINTGSRSILQGPGTGTTPIKLVIHYVYANPGISNE